MASEKIILDIKGEEADSHKVPASILVSMLKNLEDLFYLMANEDQGIEFDCRLRISAETRKNYKFLCSIPQTGSYSLPVEIESPDIEEELFSSPETTVVKFKNLLMDGNFEYYNRYFKTPKTRLKALTLAQSALPPIDSNYYVDILMGTRMGNSRKLQGNLKILEKDTQSSFDNIPNFSILCGYLQKIDFKSSSFELSYPPTKRTFKCYYRRDEIIDKILEFAAEDKDNLLQVSGDLTIGENEEPRELSNISNVCLIDVSPIVISEFEKDNKRFKFNKQIQLLPHIDDTKQLYQLEYPDLGLDISVFTRSELEDEIKEQISLLWYEYAEEDDKNLTNDAISLKNKILSMMEVEDL